jgi:hypothetical protein
MRTILQSRRKEKRFLNGIIEYVIIAEKRLMLKMQHLIIISLNGKAVIIQKKI